MTDMMKKDNDISRVASGLMAVTVVGTSYHWLDSRSCHLGRSWDQQAGTVVARTIRHFLPDGFTVDCPLLSATPYSVDHLGNLGSSIRDDHGLWRRVLSAFRLGDLLWLVSALFVSIAILKLLEPTGRTQ